MKKINIIHYKMVVGGIESSLISLVNCLNKTHDVKVYTIFPGEWDDRINCSHESLLRESEEKIFNLKINKKKTNLKEFFKMFNMGIRYLSGNLAKKLSSKIRKAELNICFLPSRICIDVTRNLKGNTFCFIHGDVRAVGFSKWKLKRFKKFDKIIAVSESCKNQIAASYPQLKNKLDFIYNTQDNDTIIKKSKEKEIEFDKSKLNIISVSRLSEEKAYIRSLKVMKRLKDEGFDFNWHILGDGTERENIEKCIKENNLENCVKLYGNQSNPYPYIKSADLLYLGSYHESYGLVLIESMLLGRPILTTKTISAEEVVDKKYGWICDNDENGIYQGLKEILSNPKLVEEKRKNLKDFSYDNDAIIEKLIKLIK